MKWGKRGQLASCPAHLLAVTSPWTVSRGAVAFSKLRRTHENANDLVHGRQVSRDPWPPCGQQPALCLWEGAPGLLAACRGQAFGTRCTITLVSPWSCIKENLGHARISYSCESREPTSSSVGAAASVDLPGPEGRALWSRAESGDCRRVSFQGAAGGESRERNVCPCVPCPSPGPAPPVLLQTPPPPLLRWLSDFWGPSGTGG